MRLSPAVDNPGRPSRAPTGNDVDISTATVGRKDALLRTRTGIGSDESDCNEESSSSSYSDRSDRAIEEEARLDDSRKRIDLGGFGYHYGYHYGSMAEGTPASGGGSNFRYACSA